MCISPAEDGIELFKGLKDFFEEYTTIKRGIRVTGK